jgi:hypothetical protein
MNSLAYACAALVGTVVPVFASPTDRVIIAAMKLSEQPNYSWFSTIDEDSASYEIEGRTTPAGVSWLRMPMITALGRRLGRENDTQLEALFRGRSVGVVRLGDDWRSIDELPMQRDREPERPRTMVRGSAAGNFGIPGGQSVGAAAPFLEDRRGSHALASLRFGVTHPHEDLAIIVSSFTSMEVKDEVVTGMLSDTGAALLLVRGEQGDVEPLAAAGSFKLWLKQGVVVRYQLKLEGVIATGRWQKKNVQLNVTTTLKDIGTTRVTVPDAAAARLQQM